MTKIPREFQPGLQQYHYRRQIGAGGNGVVVEAADSVLEVDVHLARFGPNAHFLISEHPHLP